jgi:hypothetical protein
MPKDMCYKDFTLVLHFRSNLGAALNHGRTKVSLKCLTVNTLAYFVPRNYTSEAFRVPKLWEARRIY